MLYVLVALALPHGYGHRRHRERFRHNEEGVAEQQIDALTLKLEKLEDKVDELMIGNAERVSGDDESNKLWKNGNAKGKLPNTCVGLSTAVRRNVPMCNPCRPCRGQGMHGDGASMAITMVLIRTEENIR